MSDQEKTKALLENLFYEHLDLEGKLLEVAVRQGGSLSSTRERANGMTEVGSGSTPKRAS